jgi:hypothetical protein
MLIFLQKVDTIIGEVTSSMVIVLAFESPLRYLTLSWFGTKNEGMLLLNILVVLDRPWLWLEPLAISISSGLNHIRH